MAKISIEVDTSDKTMVVTVDGKKVSNANEVYVGKYGDYFELHITSVEEIGDDLRKVTRLSADEKGILIDTTSRGVK